LSLETKKEIEMGRFSPQRYYDDPEGYFKKFWCDMEGFYMGKRWSALPEKVQQLIYKSCEGDASEAYYDLERMYEDAAKMCINTPIAFPVFLTLLKIKEQDPVKVAKIDEVLSCYVEVEQDAQSNARLGALIAMVREIVDCLNCYYDDDEATPEYLWEGCWKVGDNVLETAKTALTTTLWEDVLARRPLLADCEEVASIIVDYAKHLAQGY
jgi:hypothetical protein